MIIEINYLTVAIVAGILSAICGVLWAMGRTFLAQYGRMLGDQLVAHRATDAAALAAIVQRLDKVEAEKAAHMARLEAKIDGRLDAQDDEISELRGVSSKALTHRDLEDLYTKVNSTSNSVHEMKGLLGSMDATLRTFLARITEKGIQ